MTALKITHGHGRSKNIKSRLTFESGFGLCCKTTQRSIVLKLKIEMFMVCNYFENVSI